MEETREWCGTWAVRGSPNPNRNGRSVCRDMPREDTALPSTNDKGTFSGPPLRRPPGCISPITEILILPSTLPVLPLCQKKYWTHHPPSHPLLHSSDASPKPPFSASALPISHLRCQIHWFILEWIDFRRTSKNSCSNPAVRDEVGKGSARGTWELCELVGEDSRSCEIGTNNSSHARVRRGAS